MTASAARSTGAWSAPPATGSRSWSDTAPAAATERQPPVKAPPAAPGEGVPRNRTARVEEPGPSAFSGPPVRPSPDRETADVLPAHPAAAASTAAAPGAVAVTAVDGPSRG